MKKNIRNNKKSFFTKRFIKYDLFVFLSFIFCSQLSAQTSVTGKVSSGDSAIADVSVILKGTSQGTRTDTNGEFSINAPKNGTLVFSHLGFNPSEVKIKSQSVMSVALTSEAGSLEEVVVIGYGTEKKVNLTGSIAAISGKQLKDLPVANLSNALAGRLAGVRITRSGGAPMTSSSISIRSAGTWNNSSPLYVIDGVVRDQVAFDALDPSEVANISVLKDGASASVYGSRAANGVILVTTKRGEIGKAVINYSGSVGIDQAIKIPTMENALEQAVLINDALRVNNVDTSDSRFFSQDELNYYKTHGTNGRLWIDEAWRNPITTRHALSVSGGTSKVRYFINGAYYYATGSFDRLSFEKYTLRSNVEADITKDLSASLNISTNSRNDNKPFWLYDDDDDNFPDLYAAYLYRSSMILPYIDGKLNGTFNEWSPIAITNGLTGYNKKKLSDYNAIVSLQYKVPFVNGLKLKAMYNNYSSHAFIKQFSLPYTMYLFETSGYHNHIVTDKPAGSKIRDDGEFLYESYDNPASYQFDGYITYDRSFGKHTVNALLVYEQSESHDNNFNAQRDNFISPSVDQLFAGNLNDQFANGTGSEDGRESYIGRVNYNYAGKYIATAAFRYDGSVKFAPGKRWGFFPSLSGAWRISEEPFFKNIRLINNLKLRGSVALVGNDDIGGWQWTQRYNITNGAYFGSITNGIAPGVLPNPAVTWEKSLSYDGGIDASLFNNKLNLSADIFYRHTYDILGSRQKSIPSTFGASLPDENYGVINTHGFELVLGYNNTIGNNLKYTVSGNIGFATNKVIVEDQPENQRAYKSIIGYNTNRIWGYEATGIIRTEKELNVLPSGYTIFGQKPELGMMNYKDVRGVTSDNPDGMIDGNDQSYISRHNIPPLTYGVSLGGSWKGLTLNLLLQGSAGNDIMISRRSTETRIVGKNFAFWNDHWTPENINAPFPRVTNNTASQPSTFWLRNGSFIRLKNVELSYDLPKKMLRTGGSTSIRVFFIGTNLLLLEDHIKIMDPEAASLTSYPLMKNYSFGLNVTL